MLTETGIKEVIQFDTILFRLYRFSSDKTGSRSFQGIVHNILIRKSIIAHRMRGLSTLFWILTVLSGFSGLKPEVGFFLSYFAFFSRQIHVKAR